jgi:hypothetical protein
MLKDHQSNFVYTAALIFLCGFSIYQFSILKLVSYYAIYSCASVAKKFRHGVRKS